MKKHTKKITYLLSAALLSAELAVAMPVSTPAYAATTGVVNTAALNVRSGASTSYSRLGLIYQGATVTIHGSSGSWYQVTANIGGVNRTGYVHKDYINVTGGSTGGSTNSGSTSGGTGKVNVSALNFRTGPSESYGVIGLLYSGATVTIHETSGQWYKVTATVNGRSATGYVFAQYVTPVSGGSGNSGNTGNSGNNGSGSVVSGSKGRVNTSALNFRSGASTSASRYGCLYMNQEVTILGKTGDWYQVQASIGGSVKTGYVSAQYIDIISNGSGNSGNNGSTGNNSGSGNTGSVSNKVGVVKEGPLNVRTGPSTSHSALGSISQGTQLKVLSSENGWYKVEVLLYGKTVTAYVSAQYVTITGDSGSTGNGGNTGNNGSSGNGAVTTNKVGVVNDGPLNVRTGPSTGYAALGSIAVGTQLKVLSSENGWYKVEVLLYGKTVTGYVSAQYVTINGDNGSTGGGDNNNGSGDNGSGTTNPDFEKQLAAFPESYRASLRALHAKYPNWVFKAVNTGLNWSDVIAGENVVAINVLQTSINANTDFGKLSTMEGAYDWATDKYTLCDAGGFYTVSEDVLEYYMDPRNMLSEKYIFQFESQAYDASQTKDVVQGILNGTFMAGNYSYYENGRQVTKNYADTFMESGKAGGVSPYFLAARSRQEVGVNGSGSTSGNYGAYKGYYNYFNIGANSSADPISLGLQYAKGGPNGTATSYNRPWTNPYKAIIGGGDFLGASYIRIGQNTAYFQKFNVVYKQALYKHQYMSAILAPYMESQSIYNSYSKMGVLNKEFVFYIPVYNNMPSSPCAMPAFSGNPNSYLKALSVTGGGQNLLLTPTFNYKTTTYDIVVPAGVTQVNISANSVSAYAKGISGTGTFNLKPGMNTFKVTCTAGNGTTTTYTLNISRTQ